MDDPRSRPLALLGAAVLVLACALRFVHLDADPHYYGWTGHMLDEGRWVEHARALAQRGRLVEHDENHHLVVAPGFAAATYAVFALAGVGRTSARVVPALCGAGLLVGVWIFLRRRASPSARLAALAAIALQADYLVLSRVAVPETPILLGSLVAWWLLAGAPPSRRRLFAAGLVAAATLGMKLTAFPLVAALAAVVLVAPETGDLRRRLGQLAVFGAGLALPALLLLAASAPVWLPHAERFEAHLRFAATFLEPRDLYTLAALPVADFAAPVLNPYLLGLWLAALAGFAGRVDPGNTQERRALRAAATWAAVELAVVAVPAYAPARYLFQVLTPLALATALAATRLERVGASGLARALAAGPAARRLLAAAVLAAPSAILLAPPATAALAGLGLPSDRLSLQLGLGAALVAALGAAVARFGLGRRRVAALLAFPWVAATLWLALWLLRQDGFAFWPESGAPSAATWWALLAAAAVLGGVVVAFASRNGARPTRWPTALAGLAWLAVWAVHVAPGFVAPHYTLRDASRELAALVPAEATVFQRNGSGLCLDNALSFRRLLPGRWAQDAPEWVLILSPFGEDTAELRRLYEPVRAWDLYVPPVYRGDAHDSSDGACPSPRGRCLTLYRRADASGP